MACDLANRNQRLPFALSRELVERSKGARGSTSSPRTELLAAVAICVFASVSIAAEPLRDPTQPPPGYIDAPASTEGEGDTGPVLQSVILRKGHKPIAIIGGERVELGGRYGESRLVQVRENGVVLAGPGGRETLRLTPAVEKTPIKPAGKPSMRQTEKAGSEQ